MAQKKLSRISPTRFVRLAKRLAKLRPGSAAANKLRPLVENELMDILHSGGKRAAVQAIRGLKFGRAKLEMVERKSGLAKFRTTLGVGLQILEIWLIASKAIRGTNVVYTRRRAPAKRTAKRKRASQAT
jgi:hypothetical protein